MAQRLAGQQRRLPGGSLDWPLPAGELALAVEHLKPRAVLLYSSKALHLPGLGKLLTGVESPNADRRTNGMHPSSRVGRINP